MKKLITAPIILLMFFSMPSVSLAQFDDDEYDYEDPDDETFMIGPRGGYYEADDAENGAWTIGLQARKHFNEWFGMELAVSYRSSSEFQTGFGSIETGFVPITASALVYLPLGEHFWPYGIAGVGGYVTFTDVEGLPETEGMDRFGSDFNFGYHLGFGIEVPISNDIAINADYRYIWLDPADDFPEESINDFNGHAITFGLMFYL